MMMEKGRKVKVLNNTYSSFDNGEIVIYTGKSFLGEDSKMHYEFSNEKDTQWLVSGDFELVTNNYGMSDTGIYFIKGGTVHNIALDGSITVSIDDSSVYNIYNELYFNPSNYELNRNVLSIYLKDGEFKVVVKRKVLTFAEEFSNKITYDLLTRKITNTQDKFLFKDEEDNEHTYFLHQIVSFQNVKHLIDEYASKFENNKEVVLSSEYNVKVSKAAEDLNAEIMEFHMDVLVNKYLDEGNFDALDELFNG